MNKLLLTFASILSGMQIHACEGPIIKPSKPISATDEKAYQKAQRLNSFLDAVRKPALTISEVEVDGKKIDVFTFDDYQDAKIGWQMSLDEAKKVVYQLKRDRREIDEEKAQFRVLDKKGTNHQLTEIDKTLFAKRLFTLFANSKELKELKEKEIKMLDEQEKRASNPSILEKWGKDREAAKARWRMYKQIMRNRDVYIAALLTGDKELIAESMSDTRKMWADPEHMLSLGFTLASLKKADEKEVLVRQFQEAACNQQ